MIRGASGPVRRLGSRMHCRCAPVFALCHVAEQHRRCSRVTACWWEEALLMIGRSNGSKLLYVLLVPEALVFPAVCAGLEGERKDIVGWLSLCKTRPLCMRHMAARNDANGMRLANGWLATQYWILVTSILKQGDENARAITVAANKISLMPVCLQKAQCITSTPCVSFPANSRRSCSLPSHSSSHLFTVMRTKGGASEEVLIERSTVLSISMSVGSTLPSILHNKNKAMAATRTQAFQDFLCNLRCSPCIMQAGGVTVNGAMCVCYFLNFVVKPPPLWLSPISKHDRPIRLHRMKT
jgi:hypothetical protein